MTRRRIVAIVALAMLGLTGHEWDQHTGRVLPTSTSTTTTTTAPPPAQRASGISGVAG